MIDPDGIQVQETNLPSVISIKQVPEFESSIYNLEDEKDYNTFIKDIERQVRQSYEYRQFTRFCRDNFGMNKCAILKDVTNENNTDIKIEIHHYPFSLHDIVDIVVKKRQYYHESLEVQMVAKEVMQLHYKAIVGLIPLSETAHELAHASRLFIPVDRVFGRYNLFVDYYKPFIDSSLLDSLERIEKYTMQHSPIDNTTILEQNNVEFQIIPKDYQLPDLSQVNDNMIHQIQMIKDNNYLLPDKKEMEELENRVPDALEFHTDKVEIPLPIITEWKFDYTTKKKES